MAIRVVIFCFYAIFCLGSIGCFAFTRATTALRRSNLHVKNNDFTESSVSTTDGIINIKSSSRRVFLNTMLVGFPSISNAIEFVPASPSFQGTLTDTEEIISAQRLALNNIADVIRQGDIDEAGFKILQLITQTKMGGEIVLATFQEQLPSTGSTTALLRFQSCQKKFAYLMESFDDCKIAYENALKGKLGSTAAAQLKLLSIIDTSKNLYDEFLLELNLFKSEV